MKRKAVRTASGSGIVTINTERRCSRKTTLTRVTTIVSSIKARFKVWTARSMKIGTPPSAPDGVLDVPHALDEAQASNDRPGTARFDDVAADVPVAPHDRLDDGRERDLVGAQPVGVDVDLVLPHRAADARDFRDAGHRVELVADEPVLER